MLLNYFCIFVWAKRNSYHVKRWVTTTYHLYGAGTCWRLQIRCQWKCCNEI